MKQKLLPKLLIIALILTLLSGCANVIKSSALHVYSWSSSLGGSDDLSTTIFSYSVNLTNESDQDFYIDTLQPVIKETVKDKITSDVSVKVGKELKAHSTIQINGELSLDTKNLSKPDISKLEPFITGFKVSSEETIKLN